MTNLCKHFGNDLKASGVANLFVFHEKANDVFKIVADKDDDDDYNDLEIALNKVIKHIKEDTKSIPQRKDQYQLRMK